MDSRKPQPADTTSTPNKHHATGLASAMQTATSLAEPVLRALPISKIKPVDTAQGSSLLVRCLPCPVLFQSSFEVVEVLSEHGDGPLWALLGRRRTICRCYCPYGHVG
jgi:hypothetical protein